MTDSCSEHREIQILLALRRRLAEKGLSEQERKKLEAEIARLEDRIGIS